MTEEASTPTETVETVVTEETTTPGVEETTPPVEEVQPTEVPPVVEETPEPPKPTAEEPVVPERVVPKEVGEYTLPDGVPVAMAEFAKANDFTQEQLDASLTQFGSIIQANRTNEVATMRAAGEAHIKAMGAEAEHNMGLAKRALKQLDSDGKMTKLLNTSGFGNHPDVIDFLYSIGNSLKEGGFLKSSANIPRKGKTAAEKMYPNMKTNNQ